MENWREILRQSISTAEELAKYLPIDINITKKIIDKYPLRINPYFLSLIQFPGDPIWKQCVPDPFEIMDSDISDDPLQEELQSPVRHLIHRYPDRVVLLVSNQCAVFCRFCMRKRRLLQPGISHDSIQEGIAYIRDHHGIRDVILSGGDPLLLNDDMLYDILQSLRNIPHVEILRIHTRIPCALPHRITPELGRMFKQFHPLFINIHFNHPDEITPESANACQLLADHGIPLGAQTVLLKGINDDPQIMKQLMTQLIKNRIKPYYIHHPDIVRGTSHFRMSPEKGLLLMQKLRGFISGMCVPHYMIDLPGGGGKISIQPDYCLKRSEKSWLIRNYEGKVFEYAFKGDEE